MDPLLVIVDDLIDVQRKNIWLALLSFVSFLLIGIVVTIILYSLTSTHQLPDLLKIGPSIITAALSSVQFRTFAVSRERLRGFKSLRVPLERPDALPIQEREAFRQIVRDTIRDVLKR